MRNIVLALVAVLFIGSSANAQEDWREELQKEYVEVVDGTLVYEGYDLVTISIPGFQPVRAQVKTRAEAPDSVMSRDYFLSFTTAATMLTLLTMYSQAYQVTVAEFIAGFDAKSLEAPIGNPDLELNLTMTAEGFQIEIVDTTSGESHRSTQTWDEVFGSDSQ